MIALASDYLLLRLANGESRPVSAAMVSIDLLKGTTARFDPEFLKHATHAVFHYFKHELGRQTVTVGEFAGAMEKVLHGFALAAQNAQKTAATAQRVAEADLGGLALESCQGGELFFFPRLREEFRRQVRQAPRVLHFRGLRAASKQLAGARRWSARCQARHDQIVEFLRQCLTAESPNTDIALLVQ